MKRVFLILAAFIVSNGLVAAELRFQPGDTIDITVFNSPELSGSFRIQTDGYIRMPLVGKVQASGKTEGELHDSVRAAVDTFVKDPYITLIPKFTVTVLGSVNRPGAFTISGSERVVELVAQAGGFSNDSSGKITLYRNGKTVKFSKNDVMTLDPEFGFLRPGDVIVAQRRALTKADYSIIISTLSAISVSLYYFSNRN